MKKLNYKLIIAAVFLFMEIPAAVAQHHISRVDAVAVAKYVAVLRFPDRDTTIQEVFDELKNQ